MTNRNQNLVILFGIIKKMIRNQQLDKLSDLFMHIGEALLVAAFATQFFTGPDIIVFTKTLTLGVFSIYFSLKLIELKEDKK